jgi:hypothetical protein
VPTLDPLGVAFLVAEALDAGGIRYSVGGSLASSFSGEPRTSLDADLVIDMAAADADAFIARLGADFYADVEALRRAIASHTTVNVIHRPSGVKVDLFIAHSLLDRRQLARRRRIQVRRDPPQFLYVHSAEDILLQKLLWFRESGGQSDRQWRDARGIILQQGPRLDLAYLEETARLTSLSDLLDRAFRESGVDRG